METRADAIGVNAGYALLRTIVEVAPPRRRINLIGHSFRCKVVCSLLEALLQDRATVPLPAATEINVVLLQAAFDNNDLEPDNIYGLLSARDLKLRMLITTSQLDDALAKLYPRAEALNLFKRQGTPRVALGFGGPTPQVHKDFAPVVPIAVGPGFTRNQVPSAGRLVIADLTPLHSAPESQPFHS